METIQSLPDVHRGSPLNHEHENRMRSAIRRGIAGAFDSPIGVAILRRRGGSTVAVAGATFAQVVTRTGTLPPYRYVCRSAVMDINGAWTEAADPIDFANTFNLEEQGTGGQWVNPLNAGDVVVIYPAPGGAEAFVCHRAHYRGTY